MSRYFIDTEFNGYKGELLSLCLVRDDTKTLYITIPPHPLVALDPWVKEHVMPFMKCVPDFVETIQATRLKDVTQLLEDFLVEDEDPVIVADWPDDIHYLSQLLLTGPGTMINIPRIKFELCRIDAYPTTLVGAVQHNAAWDALCLRQKWYELFHPDAVIL